MKSFFNLWTSGQDASKVSWERIIELDLEDFPWPWSDGDWRELPNNGRNYLMFWNEDAFILWDLDGSPAAYLLKILVAPNARGQGLAAKLMDQSQEWLSNEGYDSGVLEVSVDNEAAINLYKAQGWQDLRRIRNFYRDGTDAISMQKLF